MSLDIKSLGEPLNAVDIAQVEEKFGVLFPEEYKSFLLAHNGAKFTPSTFGQLEVFYFYGIMDVPKHFDMRRVWSNLGVMQSCDYPFPDDVLPIGTDRGGNQFCIGWSGDRKGKMFFWDHEAIGEEFELTFLADSLNDFLSVPS